MLRLRSKAELLIIILPTRGTARIIPVFPVYRFLLRIFQLLTGTSYDESVNKAKKNALKSETLPSLNAICWKLTKIYSSVNSSNLQTSVWWLASSCPPPHVQKSVKFRDLMEQLLRSLLTFKLSKFCALSSCLNGYSLLWSGQNFKTCKKKKKKKYWKGPKHKAKLYVLTLRLEFIFSTFITEVKIKLNSIFNYSILSTQPLT